MANVDLPYIGFLAIYMAHNMFPDSQISNPWRLIILRLFGTKIEEFPSYIAAKNRNPMAFKTPT